MGHFGKHFEKAFWIAYGYDVEKKGLVGALCTEDV